MSSDGPIDLEELVITAYCALDDALKHAGIVNDKGKLVPRRGPPPAVDDREVLCLCLLQEWLGFDLFQFGNEMHQEATADSWR